MVTKGKLDLAEVMEAHGAVQEVLVCDPILEELKRMPSMADAVKVRIDNVGCGSGGCDGSNR